MSERWCGVTSAVTASPSARAAATQLDRTSAVEMCRKCTRAAREPHEGDVAGHHQLLGLGRDPREHRAGSTTPLRACRHRAARASSSQCWASVTSKPRAYSKARRMTATSWTPAPVVGEEPDPQGGQLAHGRQALAGAPHRDGAGHGHLAHGPAPSDSTSSATAALSTGGSVLGMATTAVNPPSAAARAPVSTVSASSAPGWRRWVWRSTRPGATRQPPASSTVAPRGDRHAGPTSTHFTRRDRRRRRGARPRRRRPCHP